MNKEVVEQQDNVVTTKDKYNRVITQHYSVLDCTCNLLYCKNLWW